MRLIYADEAGTSAHEPVCVVATVIVHGDDQWRPLQTEMQRIIDARVPENIRQGFEIHATEIYSGGKRIKREEWPFEERLDFLKELACLPLVHEEPISVGIEFKGGIHAMLEKEGSLKLNASQWAHLMAFNMAMERADYFLREHLNGNEIGTVVAEDVDRMRELLTNFGLSHRAGDAALGSENLRPTQREVALGLAPAPVTYRIDHIVDVPHFVKKGKAPILQLADVCAFSFRHYLSRKPNGADLVLAMLGPREGPEFVNDDVWFSACSSGLFNTEKYWSDERRKGVALQDAQLLIKRLLGGG